MLAPNPQMPMDMAAPAPKWHDVTVTRKRKYEYACVEPVPPEEFGISRNARNIRDAGYVFHEMARSESELIDEGFDEDQVKGLPTYVTHNTGGEDMARDTVNEGDTSGDGSLNRANRMVKVTEHYVRMDYEGSGKAKLYRVTTGGDDSTVLIHNGEPAVVEEEYICFAAMTPVIVTHRFFGKSVADLVMDIQKIKTALTRGMLDHLYRANNPRPVVEEISATENTLDDLLLSRHGAPIRVKANAASAIVWQTIPDISGAIYPALQYFDATREWRTGVSRQGQGLDPSALQNQVATIANQMLSASQAKMKLIARIFAETGIRDLFALLHATVRKHGNQQQTVRLRNKWVPVDPRSWKARDDMTINVGLGEGTKQEKLASVQLLIAAQEKAIAAGMVSKRNLHETATELSKLLGYRNPDRFFVSPDDNQQQQTDPASAPIQPPPDPKMAEMQAKAEIEKLQAQADIETNKQKAQVDYALKDREFQQKAALEERKFELEKELKLIDMQIKQDEHRQNMQMKMADHAMQAEQGQADHSMKMEQGRIKTEQAKMKGPRFDEDVASPVSKLIERVEDMSKDNAKQLDTVKAMIAANKRPKKIKGPSGKIYEIQD